MIRVTELSVLGFSGTTSVSNLQRPKFLITDLPKPNAHLEMESNPTLLGQVRVRRIMVEPSQIRSRSLVFLDVKSGVDEGNVISG
jgi:hypothetical protein